MRLADILRQLADTIDQKSNPATPDPTIQNKAEPMALPTGQNVIVIKHAEPEDSPNGTTASGNDKNPEDLFLPPLQQELLKKAVGVENVYDDGDTVEQEEQECDTEQEDIVDRIKRLSGVPVAAIQELSNDDVVDD